MKTLTSIDIQNLMVGDKVPNCFGEMAKVVEIYARGADIKGKWYVCTYQEFGTNNGRMSQSFTEGEPNLTINGPADCIIEKGDSNV